MRPAKRCFYLNLSPDIRASLEAIRAEMQHGRSEPVPLSDAGEMVMQLGLLRLERISKAAQRAAIKKFGITDEAIVQNILDAAKNKTRSIVGH